MPHFAYEGHRLAYTIYGRGDRPMMLLHGQMLSQTRQEALAMSLAEHGQRVITLDLLGHGQSDRPDDMSLYSMGQYAEQVLALLDHLGIDKAVIAGTSLGANVALEFAALAPDRLQGLMIEMPVLEHGVVAAVMIFAPLLEIMVLAKPVVRAVSAIWSRGPRERLPLFGQIVVEALAQDHNASASVLQGLVYGRTAPPARLRRTFAAPALVIGHPRDPLHPFSDADTLSRELPNATLLQASSIFELRTRPERLTPMIAAWLDAAWDKAGNTPQRPRVAPPPPSPPTPRQRPPPPPVCRPPAAASRPPPQQGR